MKQSVYWAVVLVLIAVAVFVRFHKLGAIPISLYWDEAAILADARSVAKTGHDIHGNHWFQPIFPSYGDYKLPVLIWLASVSVQVFGATETAVRGVSAVAGLGTVVVGVRLFLELQKLVLSKSKLSTATKQISTIVMLAVLGTSFWAVQFSRTAFEGHIGQFLVAVSVYITLKAQRRNWLYLVAAVVGTVAVYTYYSVRFVWPVVFLAAAVLPYLVRHASVKALVAVITANKKRAATTGLYILTGVGLFFGLLIWMWQSPYYQVSQQYRLSADSILNREPQVLAANQLREIAGNTVLDRVVFHRDLLTLKLLAQHYSQHLSVEYIFLTGDSNLRHGTGQFGLFAAVLVIPFLAGAYSLAKQSKLVLLFMGIWWLSSLLPASVPFDVPHALRSLNALLPLSLIISFGAVYLLTQLSGKGRYISAALILVFIFQLLQFWNFYTLIYPSQSAHAWQGGYKEIVEAVSALKSEYQEVHFEFADKRIYLWFLAYPVTTVEQVQQLPKRNFEVQQIDQLYFSNYDYADIETRGTSLLLVDEEVALQKALDERGLEPTTTQIVTDPTGSVRYMLAGFKP